ncbi:MAG: porin family protein [Dysgonomonas sp.]
MKKIVLYFAVTSCFLVLSTQAAISQVRFGIKGGYDVIDHSINSDILKVSNRLGYQLGASLEILPFNGLGLETGVMYGHQKFTVEEKLRSAELSDYDYISIPLNLKFRLSLVQILGVYATGGAYGSVKLKGGDLKLATEEFKSKQFEAGVNAGAGITLFSNFDVGINFRYKLTDNFEADRPSLSDISDLNKSQTKYWSVSASYYF